MDEQYFENEQSSFLRDIENLLAEFNTKWEYLKLKEESATIRDFNELERLLKRINLLKRRFSKRYVSDTVFKLVTCYIEARSCRQRNKS